MRTFQENLKQFRERAGFTAKDFAAVIGCGYTTYLSYENEGREPRQETLCRIAAALDVSIDTLLGHAAPGEHARLVAYARACGLEVSEADGMVIVRLTADGLEGLTPSTMEVLQGLDIQPVTVRDFDSIVTHTQSLMEERTREQALFEIAYALNSTLQTIKKLPAE